MSARLTKLNDLIELAILLQNCHNGLTYDDIANHFECSRRTAERMKNVLEETYPFQIEEVEILNSRKKHWRFKKDTKIAIIKFDQNDINAIENALAKLTDEQLKLQLKLLKSKIEINKNSKK